MRATQSGYCGGRSSRHPRLAGTPDPARAQVARRFWALIWNLPPQQIAALIGAVFIGAEAYILLGLEKKAVPIRKALRARRRTDRRIGADPDREVTRCAPGFLTQEGFVPT